MIYYSKNQQSDALAAFAMLGTPVSSRRPVHGPGDIRGHAPQMLLCVEGSRVPPIDARILSIGLEEGWTIVRIEIPDRIEK